MTKDVLSSEHAPPPKAWSLRRWIRRGFLAWALVSTLWLFNSYRTQGVDPALLASDSQVSVRRSDDSLAFLPVSETASSGLVFIVGAGVAPEAYAPLLRPIAAEGHPVIVVALPYRIAPLEQHKTAAVERARSVIENEKSAQRWVVAGHSLGGALASRIAGDAPSQVKAIVLIGTSHPKRMDLSGSRIPITKVFATQDGVATLEMINSTRNLLPASTRWIEIQGGNHSQFGHYGHQLFDGSPAISRERQQALTREALVEALRTAAAGRDDPGGDPSMSRQEGGMREFWFENDSVRLYAVEGGEGRVIVMLHGGMASHVASLPLISPLASRYRVITPDVRGNGKSWSGAPLTFDQLADDVAALLDHIGEERAVVGGVSGGSGVALRFALRHPGRTAGLVLVQPVYAGEDRGYNDAQKQTFAMMDSVASRALAEGVQVLRPMYANLPPEIREKALAMIEGFDAASVVATSHFIASGAQPFASAAELRALSVPTLLIRGDDPLHPAGVSDLYAENIPGCTVAPASTSDVAAEIGAFCDQRAF